MPLNQTALATLLKRLRSNDPKLKELDLTPIKIYELNDERQPQPNTIRYDRNYIGEEQWSHIVDAIQANRTLEKLNLQGSGIGTLGAQQLAAILPNKHTLKILDLSYNQISNQGIIALTDALAQNTSITYFNFAYNLVNQRQETCQDATARAKALIKLVRSTPLCRHIDFPGIKRSSPKVLNRLRSSIVNNPLITFEGDLSDLIVPSFDSEDLLSPVLSIMIDGINNRNKALSGPLQLLQGRLNKNNVSDYLPNLPKTFASNTNIQEIIIDAMVTKLQWQRPWLYMQGNLDSMVDDVLRLLKIQKSTLNDRREGMVLLKKPFCNSKLQAIADNLLCLLLEHQQIFSQQDQEQQILGLWFRAYHAIESKEVEAFEVAMDVLQEMGAIPKDMDKAMFTEKVLSLKNELGNYRTQIVQFSPPRTSNSFWYCFFARESDSNGENPNAYYALRINT